MRCVPAMRLTRSAISVLLVQVQIGGWTVTKTLRMTQTSMSAIKISWLALTKLIFSTPLVKASKEMSCWKETRVHRWSKASGSKTLSLSNQQKNRRSPRTGLLRPIKLWTSLQKTVFLSTTLLDPNQCPENLESQPASQAISQTSRSGLHTKTVLAEMKQQLKSKRTSRRIVRGKTTDCCYKAEGRRSSCSELLSMVGVNWARFSPALHLWSLLVPLEVSSSCYKKFENLSKIGRKKLIWLALISRMQLTWKIRLWELFAMQWPLEAVFWERSKQLSRPILLDKSLKMNSLTTMM